MTIALVLSQRYGMLTRSRTNLTKCNTAQMYVQPKKEASFTDMDTSSAAPSDTAHRTHDANSTNMRGLTPEQHVVNTSAACKQPENSLVWERSKNVANVQRGAKPIMVTATYHDNKKSANRPENLSQTYTKPSDRQVSRVVECHKDIHNSFYQVRPEDLSLSDGHVVLSSRETEPDPHKSSVYARKDTSHVRKPTSEREAVAHSSSYAALEQVKHAGYKGGDNELEQARTHKDLAEAPVYQGQNRHVYDAETGQLQHVARSCTATLRLASGVEADAREHARDNQDVDASAASEHDHTRVNSARNHAGENKNRADAKRPCKPGSQAVFDLSMVSSGYYTPVYGHGQPSDVPYVYSGDATSVSHVLSPGSSTHIYNRLKRNLLKELRSDSDSEAESKGARVAQHTSSSVASAEDSVSPSELWHPIHDDRGVDQPGACQQQHVTHRSFNAGIDAQQRASHSGKQAPQLSGQAASIPGHARNKKDKTNGQNARHAHTAKQPRVTTSESDSDSDDYHLMRKSRSLKHLPPTKQAARTRGDVSEARSCRGDTDCSANPDVSHVSCNISHHRESDGSYVANTHVGNTRALPRNFPARKTGTNVSNALRQLYIRNRSCKDVPGNVSSARYNQQSQDSDTSNTCLDDVSMHATSRNPTRNHADQAPARVMQSKNGPGNGIRDSGHRVSDSDSDDGIMRKVRAIGKRQRAARRQSSSYGKQSESSGDDLGVERTRQFVYESGGKVGEVGGSYEETERMHGGKGRSCGGESSDGNGTKADRRCMRGDEGRESGSELGMGRGPGQTRRRQSAQASDTDQKTRRIQHRKSSQASNKDEHGKQHHSEIMDWQVGRVSNQDSGLEMKFRGGREGTEQSELGDGEGAADMRVREEGEGGLEMSGEQDVSVYA
jgi:hypothetical protein